VSECTVGTLVGATVGRGGGRLRAGRRAPEQLIPRAAGARAARAPSWYLSFSSGAGGGSWLWRRTRATWGRQRHSSEESSLAGGVGSAAAALSRIQARELRTGRGLRTMHRAEPRARRAPHAPPPPPLRPARHTTLSRLLAVHAAPRAPQHLRRNKTLSGPVRGPASDRGPAPRNSASTESSPPKSPRPKDRPCPHAASARPASSAAGRGECRPPPASTLPASELRRVDVAAPPGSAAKSPSPAHPRRAGASLPASPRRSPGKVVLRFDRPASGPRRAPRAARRGAPPGTLTPPAR